MKGILLIILSFAASSTLAQEFDLVIINGKLMDGTGNSWRFADVGVKDGKIIAIGNLKQASAAKVINASDRIVAPGFIDVHTHIEGNDLKVPLASNFILDGV